MNQPETTKQAETAGELDLLTTVMILWVAGALVVFLRTAVMIWYGG